MEQDEKYTSKLGYYPCIDLTFKGLNRPTFKQMLLGLKTEVTETYIDKAYLLKSENLIDVEKEMLKKYMNIKEDDDELIDSIQILSRLLYKHHQKPVMLFLDEYDVPLQNAYVNGYYEEASQFFKTFYGITFKDNAYLEKTILTGVSRVAKESIFSGANNFKVFTVLDDEFSDDFGITSLEMDKIISDFDIKDKKEEIKKWYDGYKIGNTEEIYNPWSILNYLTDKKLQAYWVNTSSNDLIKLILIKSTTVKEKIEQLLKDEEIEVIVNQDTIIRGVEQNENNIWGLLVGTGYLKVTKQIDLRTGLCKVAIPNLEIKDLFSNIIRDWFNDKVIGNDLNSILEDLITLNLQSFEKKFKILVTEMFSYMDVGKNTAENFCHAFVLGMLVGLKETYYVNSNRESGIGRYDIMLEPKDKNGNSFIMEFKVLEKLEEKTIEETIENAKKQIEEKGYEQNLIERGFTNITKVVFAFNGKEVKMSH